MEKYKVSWICRDEGHEEKEDKSTSIFLTEAIEYTIRLNKRLHTEGIVMI